MRFKFPTSWAKSTWPEHASKSALSTLPFSPFITDFSIMHLVVPEATHSLSLSTSESASPFACLVAFTNLVYSASVEHLT